jgi:hypothetical protein
MLNTLPKDRKEKIRRFTHQMIFDQKNRRKKKVNFSKQNMCIRRGRYRSSVSLTFPAQLAVSSGRTGSVLPWIYPNHRENPINYQKCPTNETPAIFQSSNLTKSFHQNR